MRVFSIILNIVMFGTVVVIMVEDGGPSELYQQLLVLTFLISPVISIITLCGMKKDNSDSWVSLFFQRKKLEERAKIEKIKSSSSLDSN